MKCPKCGADNDKVIDSRSSKDGAIVKRRRECLVCAYRFSTSESVVPADEMRVIKRSGEREPFNRDKLRRGIANACYKRPVSSEQIDRMVSEISAELGDRLGEIETSSIGELVMNKLALLDEVAFVRFASIYHHFQVADDFIQEIKEMKNG